MNNPYSSLGATRNLYNQFTKFRMNKQISKSAKNSFPSSKLNKTLNDSFNDSGNQKYVI